MNELEKLQLAALRKYFETVRVKADSGKTLRVVSDGRAGNGYTHWRAVYVAGRGLVATLEDTPSNFARVTVARKGDLRVGENHDFKSLPAALRFLKAKF